MNAERPREIVIHQSANRPNQILGGDRELVLVTILISVSLAFSLATWWGVGLSILFWLTAIAVLQRMGKADPLLRQVYLRHIRYRPFYPAKSGLYSRLRIPGKWGTNSGASGAVPKRTTLGTFMISELPHLSQGNCAARGRFS